MTDSPLPETIPELLADGAPPATPAALFARLEVLGIASRSFEHDPVYTVEEAKALRGELPGAHIKNLFLRNKKGKMWLVTCLEDRQVDLKALGIRLEAGRFSFGSAERLMTNLGVEPGSVTRRTGPGSSDPMWSTIGSPPTRPTPDSFHPIVRASRHLRHASSPYGRHLVERKGTTV